MTRTSLAALALCAWAAPALAQSDPMAAARQAAANQVGVMEYCQAQGYADADAVAAQRAALGRVPAAAGSTGTAPTDAAEALGRSGTLSMNGTQTTLQALASTHNTTVSAMCGQMASVAKQVAASMPSMPAMPAMPAMPGNLTSVPGLTAMPTMPGGMPAMPTMPGTPSATPR